MPPLTARWIKTYYRIIRAIRPHISAKHTLPGGHVNIRRNEPANLGVIVPCHQVVQPGFGVVIIASVTEGIVCAQRACQGAGGGDQLAPCIVGIFYHTVTVCVHKADYIVLAVSEVEVLCSVVIDADYIAVRIIAEQLLHLARAAALHLRHEQAAVVAEGGRNAVYSFAAAHALLVVGVARRCAVARQGLKTLALPGQRVAPVAERVADLVIGDGFAIIADELVLPCAVVGIGNSVRWRAQFTRGVGVFLTLQNVACVVVGIGRRLVREAVVHPRKLVQRIVGVACACAAFRDRRHVAVVVVGVGVCILAAVPVALQHAGPGAVRPRKVGERNRVWRAEPVYPAGTRARGVVAVGNRLPVHLYRDRAVVLVVGVFRCPVAAARGLVQLRQVVVQVVFIQVLAAVVGSRADQPSRQVVIIDRRDLPLVVHHPLKISLSVIRIAVHQGGAELHFRHPVEHIVGVVDRKPVAVFRARQQAAAVIVGVLRKRGGVHLRGKRVAEQVVGHAVGEAVVRDLRQVIVGIGIAHLRAALRQPGKPVHGIVGIGGSVVLRVGHACAKALVRVVAIAYRFPPRIRHGGGEAPHIRVGRGSLNVLRVAANSRGKGVAAAVVGERVLHSGVARGREQVVVAVVGVIELVALCVRGLHEVVRAVVFKRSVLFRKPLHAHHVAVAVVGIALAEFLLEHLHAVKAGFVAVEVVFKAEHDGAEVKRSHRCAADILPLGAVRVEADLVIFRLTCPDKAEPQLALPVIDLRACARVLREGGDGVHLCPAAEGVAIPRRAGDRDRLRNGLIRRAAANNRSQGRYPCRAY